MVSARIRGDLLKRRILWPNAKPLGLSELFSRILRLREHVILSFQRRFSQVSHGFSNLLHPHL